MKVYVILKETGEGDRLTTAECVFETRSDGNAFMTLMERYRPGARWYIEQVELVKPETSSA